MRSVRTLVAILVAICLGWFGRGLWSQEKDEAHPTQRVDSISGSPSIDSVPADLARVEPSSVTAQRREILSTTESATNPPAEKLKGPRKPHVAGTKLNDPEWWLANDYVNPSHQELTAAQRAALDSIIQSIGTELTEAARVSRTEMDAAINDKMNRGDYITRTSPNAADPEVNTMRSGTNQLVLGHRSLPSGEIVLVRVFKGDRPTYDDALEKEQGVHDEAPNRIRDLIRSFK